MRFLRRPLILGTLSLLSCACGDDTSPGMDAGADAEPSPASECAAPLPGTGCKRDADCPGEACVVDVAGMGEDLAPLPLLCAPPASAGGAAAPCEALGDCDHGLCLLAGTCATPCATQADCPPTDRCARVFVRTGPDAMQPIDACVRHAVPPPGVELERADLRAVLTGGLATVDLPARMGTALYVLSPACGVRADGRRLEAADATAALLFDSSADPPGPNPLVPRSRPLTVLVPNGRATTSPAGFRLTVESTIEVGALGDVVLTTSSHDRTGGVLDFDLFYVGGRGWSPEGARGPPDVSRALDALETFYAPAGIALGEVRQHEVVGALRARYGVVDRDREGGHRELLELFTLSAGAPTASVAVFFVRSIDGSIALSGGVPGPAAMHGTPGSGLAVGVDLLPSISRLEEALAHEVGHYLGLFHTSEFDGSVVEALDDTPECGVALDADRDGLLSLEECSANGADNLMFWSANGSMLTAAQLDVLARSHALR